MATLPYKLGIFTAVSVAFASIPLIFDLNTVLWFNELYVTTGKFIFSFITYLLLCLLSLLTIYCPCTVDVPEERDLETPLEVGSFAWNWMEPPLGQASFFLLCMQYARAQMQNLGIKPYTENFRSRRAARIVTAYPQYNRYVLESWSEGDPLSGTPINRD